MLKKGNKNFVFRNVWTFDGRILLFSWGFRKTPDLYKLSLKKGQVMDQIFGINCLFQFYFFLLRFGGVGGGGLSSYINNYQFLTSKFVILLLYIGIASLMFCFNLKFIKNLINLLFFAGPHFETFYFTFLSKRIYVIIIIIISKVRYICFFITIILAIGL